MADERPPVDGPSEPHPRPEDRQPAGVAPATPTDEPSPSSPTSRSGELVERVGDLIDGAVEGVVGGAAGVVGDAVDLAQSVARRWDERPGARVRRLRRRARTPLPYLYTVHPEARKAAPHELGVKTIDVDSITGTAVGGATQRGGDFLPLKPFRSLNWNARWQRIRAANDRLAILPPIDALLYDGRYWVLDGHNRVAAALYNGQVGIDANVVELVPWGGAPSERPGSLAAVLTGSRAVRTAGRGRPVSSMSDEDRPDTPTGDT